MAEPFLGEIKIVSFNFAPKGWAFCNGQTLAIQQNQALFSILGTTYGGNGTTTFQLPNLQGRVPLHVGGGITLGQSSGEASHTLLASEMPGHSHVPLASSNPPSMASPSGNCWAGGNPLYAASPVDTAMAAQAVPNAGGGQAHENQPPYLVLTFVIALTGIFPSRN